MAPAPTSTRRESPTPSSTARTHENDDEDIARSDPDSGTEKPVREKLRTTQLESSQRGRLVKKRSHEEIEGDDSEDTDGGAGTRHVRKRSREANGEDVREGTPETTMEEAVASPKGKRTRDQVVGGVEASTEAVGTEEEQRKAKRARDSGSPEGAVDMSEAATTSPPKATTSTAASTKVPSTGGFANASATSPFGTLATKNDAPAKTAPQTSEEKFKSSGFGSFAATAASPFGAASKSTSPFGASAAASSASPWAAKNPTPATQPSAFAAPSSKPASSGFGNTSSASAFGSLGKPGSAFGGTLGTSAFSSLGGGGGSAKLSSFATSGGSSAPKIEGISSKPAKAFGASNDTDEESGGETDEDEEAVAGEKATDQDKKDRRFYEQHIETGEEGETTMFAQRAKLYHFDKGEKKWVERGSGVLKLNISDPEPASSQGTEDVDKSNLSDVPEEDDALPARKVHARLLLRAEGSQRVVLNSPIVKGAKFGDDVEPKGQAILFLGRLAGAQAGEAGLDMLQMKMNAERAKALWHHVQELQDKLA